MRDLCINNIREIKQDLGKYQSKYLLDDLIDLWKVKEITEADFKRLELVARKIDASYLLTILFNS